MRRLKRWYGRPLSPPLRSSTPMNTHGRSVEAPARGSAHFRERPRARRMPAVPPLTAGSAQMIEHRPLHELCGEDIGWLKAKRHFSLGGPDDRASRGWGALRIWNDDEIAPGAGFPPHSHANMEIITYVREGAVTHRDSLGNEGQTKAGDVQVMSAGTGIRHAEYNTGPVPALIFQIWIVPDTQGGPPAWASQSFPKADHSGGFVTL